MNIQNMIKQAQKIQEQMAQIQGELEGKTVEASAGGGMVVVAANGKQEIMSLKIAPEAVDPQDVPMLEDLVISAVNEALRSSKALMQEELSKITGGMRIPGITM